MVRCPEGTGRGGEEEGSAQKCEDEGTPVSEAKHSIAGRGRVTSARAPSRGIDNSDGLGIESDNGPDARPTAKTPSEFAVPYASANTKTLALTPASAIRAPVARTFASVKPRSHALGDISIGIGPYWRRGSPRAHGSGASVPADVGSLSQSA